MGSLTRIGAMMTRHLYVLRGSWPRVAELAYWPIMQMIVWGFMSQFLMTNSTWVAQAFGVLIAAVILWDVLFRAQLGVSFSFLEELWSRNLGHIFVSPLRPVEYLASLLAMSLIRTLVGVIPAALLAWALYHYSIFTMGLPLVAFFAILLVMGWALGIAITGLVMRMGLGAESLAWVTIFAFAPISGVYYPIAVLPGWLQPIAYALPSAHVFEGMRAVMFEQRFDWGHFAWAAGLDLFYLAAAGWSFLFAFESARMRGKLLQVGE